MGNIAKDIGGTNEVSIKNGRAVVRAAHTSASAGVSGKINTLNSRGFSIYEGDNFDSRLQNRLKIPVIKVDNV